MVFQRETESLINYCPGNTDFLKAGKRGLQSLSRDGHLEMWVSCGAPKTRFADGGGSLGKGRHELRGAQRRLPVLCIAEMGAALGCCGHPAHSDLMGALLAQGIIPPDAPGHERRFVSTFIPPGRKGSVRAGCSPAYRGGWAGMLPASLVPDSSR